MLPGLSGCMGEFLISGEIGVGERAADLTENLERGDGVCPGIGILQQWGEGLAGMRMGDGTAEGSPEPFDAIGLGIIGRGVNQHELTPGVPPGALAPAASPQAYGCPGCPAAPAPSGHAPANARRLGAVAHTRAGPTAWVPAASRTSRRASRPSRSRTPWRCCPAPRPGADHGVPCGTTPA